MSAGLAVEVEHLSKRYRLGEDQPGASLRDAIARSVHGLARGRRHGPREEIWSLRDVNLQVREGHALGVIGRNGAGKSTLLKILSRITEPTSGVARTWGRVAALLEVGTGFHPELTGRENVYLNGAILGMARRDMDRRFDDIVEFAGVNRFIDTPIKRYSSGMFLRLAFAVAAHLEPDVLIVDEVLAVGDAEFQAKCLGRMATAEREGRTVIFVSHNLDAIARLCPESIWLERGEIAARGPTGSVLDAYLPSTLAAEGTLSTGAGEGPITLESVTVTDGTRRGALRRDRAFSIDVRLFVRNRVPGLDVAVYVVNSSGVRIFDEAWSDQEEQRPDEPGRYTLTLSVPPVLNVGQYRVGVWIGSAYETVINEAGAATFQLEGSPKGRPDRVVELLLPWSVSCEDEVSSPASD